MSGQFVNRAYSLHEAARLAEEEATFNGRPGWSLRSKEDQDRAEEIWARYEESRPEDASAIGFSEGSYVHLLELLPAPGEDGWITDIEGAIARLQSQRTPDWASIHNRMITWLRTVNEFQ
jgi:hypothetical protein